MNIAEILLRSAKNSPNRVAILLGDEDYLSYEQLSSRVACLGKGLKLKYDLKPNDRVAIFSANCKEYLEALYAIYWIGAVSVPINHKLHAKELSYILEDSGAKVLMVSDELSNTIKDITYSNKQILVLGSPDYEKTFSDSGAQIVRRALEDVASLFYTSGTTGKPKGVAQTHRNLMAMTTSYLTDVDEISLGDVILYAAPMSHGAGLYNYPFMLRGAKHVIPRSGGFDPEELIGISQKVGNLSFFASPTMVKRLVDYLENQPSDISGIKTIVYGGAPMYIEDIKRALSVLGPKLVQIYGQGESPMTITVLSREHLANTAHPKWEERIASVGIPFSIMELSIVDHEGVPVSSGTIGEVITKGDVVMPYYWHQAESTAKTLREGWLYTGDTGYMDDDGFLTLKDRSKDLIISGGSNIYPRELEEVLMTHPAVIEVAVIGRNDEEWGEVPVAFVVSKSITEQELDALCLENIARFKRPKKYYFLKSLPKNNYGKVLKTELRKLLENELDTP
jgi:acyl-CoA synthetase (AMP-forming)/AMP-acid ligase II